MIQYRLPLLAVRDVEVSKKDVYKRQVRSLTARRARPKVGVVIRVKS